MKKIMNTTEKSVLGKEKIIPLYYMWDILATVFEPKQSLITYMSDCESLERVCYCGKEPRTNNTVQNMLKL